MMGVRWVSLVERPRYDRARQAFENTIASLIGLIFGAAYLAFTYLGTSGLLLFLLLLFLVS